jgi:hypothetical protein
MNDNHRLYTKAGQSIRQTGVALIAGALLPLFASNGAAWAQQPAAPATKAAAAPVAAAPEPTAAAVINAKAVERLNAMGAHLRSLKAFTVTADVTVEEVLDSGQKVENANTVEIAARMPDKLRVYSTSAERSRKIYYDGKTVTIFAEKLKYYGSFPAPGTIGATVEAAAKKYGLEVPLADLFLMGTDRFDTKSITEAIYVGPQLVGGVLCDQLAFRQPGVDWQICIDRGKAPLPRKLVVTGTGGDPAQPERRSILTWKAGSAPDAAAFTFVPPKGTTRIAVNEAAK